MGIDYDIVIREQANKVFSAMKNRVTSEELDRLHRAYEFAREQHKLQRRKSGEPYIIHPIAVASIAAIELKLGANSVCAAFLHDVVEDTPTTIEDIEQMFGSDVAFLVDTVTKKKKSSYTRSKQVDNYQQLLDSIHYDIRALMVKIADRLHNMRTLSSMRPDKQMKIAGETDYFYAPLANRLGLYDVKTELENLSFKYRCPAEYNELCRMLADETALNDGRLRQFTNNLRILLSEGGVDTNVMVYYRKPYSIWRKMKSQNRDFMHIDNKYYIRITFDENADSRKAKDVCLRIYSILTNTYRERPGSFNNQIDCAKENSYKSLNLMLLSNFGIWEDVQICSEQMVECSKVGCMASLDESKVGEWIEKFKLVLKDIASETQETKYIEKVATNLYYDDVMVFTPHGDGIILPKGATAIDLAFELNLGMRAKYARVNGHLCSLKTVLHRGDCVEIGTSQESFPKPDWFEHCNSYKAKRALRQIMDSMENRNLCCCEHCRPIPGGETIGFKQSDGTVMVHRRSCKEAIRMASENGDSIVEVTDFNEDPMITYPVTFAIHAIDRYHLLIDFIDCITNKLHLSIDSLTTVTKDEIVDCTITFFVHSIKELVTAVAELNRIQNVDEVKQIFK